MRITTHSAYLSQLTSLPRLFPVNSYIVREDDGLTLIDTGLPGNARAYLAAATKLGAPIRRVVLTHAHADHLGSLDGLAALLPGAEVIASARDARFMAGERGLDPGEPRLPLRGGYQTVKTRPTRLVGDGERVGSLLVVAAPGHTPGHIALFDTRDRSLIAGDAFQTRAGVAVAGTLRPFFPFPALATWSKPLALESARRLLELKPARLAVGHGEVLEDPAAAMGRAIAEAAAKLGEAQTHGA